MHTTTDATGSYQLQRVLVGKLRLHAWARASRCLAKVDCELVEGQTFVWDAVLAPEVDPSWQRFHGVLVGPQRALEGVTCAAAVVRLGEGPPESMGVCATNERFAARREVYTRAVGATQKRLARAGRL